MPPSPLPPVPVAAQVVFATLVMTVTFDQPLQPGPTAPGNWPATFNPGPVKSDHVNVAPGVVAGNTVTTTQVFTFLGGGLDRCSYLAAPPDVIGTNGLPAAPFADFPLAVI